MTWDEYYDSVMRNATKRGGIVIWVNPPETRKVERAKQQAPTAPAATAKHPGPKQIQAPPTTPAGR